MLDCGGGECEVVNVDIPTINPCDPILAFSAEQARSMTGLSDHQLRDWERQGLASASLGDSDRRRPFSRIFTFRDVVHLRVLVLVRDELPHERLRDLTTWLNQHAGHPWSSMRFAIADGELFLRDPRSGTWAPSLPPSASSIRQINMNEIVSIVAADAERLRRREPEDIGRITRNRFVMNGAPVLGGTRIPVEAIRSFAAAGYSVDQILEQYPRLTMSDVAAALEDDALSERLSAD
jgi:uncharacterized protein (DUF433 family)